VGAANLSSLPAGETNKPLPEGNPAELGFSVDRLDRLHRFLQSKVEAQKYSGAITFISRNGKIVDCQTFGYRDLEARAQMQKDTIVRLYSMSKLITTVAVMMLYEEGQFGLDDPVGDYIPEFKNPKVFKGGTVKKPELVDAVRPITIRHLLTHTSGITYGWENNVPGEIYRNAALEKSSSLQDFVSKLGHLPLHHQPGEIWDYGYSVDILGYLVEVISGKTFENFLADRIFQPLKMKDTGFFVPEEKQGRLAKIYKRTDSSGLAVANNLLSIGAYRPGHGFPSGGGGLFSTIGDYARFAQMLLDNGRFEGRQLLGRKTVELMHVNHLVHLSPPTIPDPPGLGFGFGGSVVTDLGRTGTLGSVGNLGWGGYATTSVEIDWKEKCVFLFFFQHLPYDQDGFWRNALDWNIRHWWISPRSSAEISSTHC
jgi:CubicO group peptidase (beta-lactamase class C family)